MESEVSLPAMNAVKVGLRRKWQATLKNREPSSSAACRADEEWERQWKSLWRDIGRLVSYTFSLQCSLDGPKLISCFVRTPISEGGEDYEALVGPIAQHDKEVVHSRYVSRHERLCAMRRGYSFFTCAHKSLLTSRGQLNASCDLLLAAIERALDGISYVALDQPESQSSAIGGAVDAGTLQSAEKEHADPSALPEDQVAPAKKRSAPPLQVFSRYKEKVLEATRDNFKIVRRMSVAFAQALAKLVRSERGVTPDEWAQQREFLIKEHLKQMDSIREEVSVQLSEEGRKIHEEREQEREETTARHEAEMADADERSQAALAKQERDLTEAHEKEVADLQEQLAVAMKRLEDGDYDLLAQLSQLRDALNWADAEKGKLRATIEDMKESELEFQKEIKRLKKDRELLNSSVEEMRKTSRAVDRQKAQAERREHKLSHDLHEARQEYHELEAKLLRETHELGALRKKNSELERAVGAAQGQLPQIAILTKKLDASKKGEKQTSELKEKMVRKCWVLENEIAQLHKDHRSLIAEIDLLRAETCQQREGQVMTELALRGVDEEVQRRLRQVGGDVIRQETRLLLAQRAQELREEAQLPLNQLRKATINFSSDSTGGEDAIRSRLLFRAAALELEMDLLPKVEDPPPVGLVAEARAAAEAAACGEDDGARLPLRVSLLHSLVSMLPAGKSYLFRDAFLRFKSLRVFCVFAFGGADHDARFEANGGFYP